MKRPLKTLEFEFFEQGLHTLLVAAIRRNEDAAGGRGWGMGFGVWGLGFRV